MVFKVTFVLLIKFQSYCISKEFAFKDQENNNMEMKPSAWHQRLDLWIVFPQVLYHKLTLLELRPPVT